MTILKAGQVLSSQNLRKKYLEFFKERGHKIIPSASLIPENDPTILFTTAGMHPLVPYLIGEKHPLGQRLTNFQKCIRTGDIDEVGDPWHLTFFEMLGNWSLGDPEKPNGIGAGYFKKEAIEMSWEFLTDEKWLGLDKKWLAVSVFAGDKDALFDKEAYNIWQKLGVAEQRLAKLPKENNWWGPAGQTGPCGPCTEMFYWSGEKVAPKVFDPADSQWVEIWNDVFMQYNKTALGKYEPLKQKNVDTGMGLERTVAVLNGKTSVYEIEIFEPIIKKIEELSGKIYGENKNIDRSMRIIADHLRAATFILGDEKGIEPSNVLQGYVLRRLIRRAIRYGKMLGISDTFTFKVADIVILEMNEVYPELRRNREFILEQLVREEEKFKKTLKEGLRKASKILDIKSPLPEDEYLKIMQSERKKSILGKIFRDRKEGKPKEIYSDFGFPISSERIFKATIFGKDAFDLYQSYGFPIEMIIELAQEKHLFVDVHNFEDELKKHQELSRTASAGQFKGGLADASEQTKKLHTAAHLMLAALRQVLGEHIIQKGSNITPERLRFDFSHSQKLTPEQIKEVEKIVNEKIQAKLIVVCEEMDIDKAKKQGAMGVFESKYGEKVKVYIINDFSKEICGGPHVENTGELGHFKIIKEESSSAGVRRIKAILE